MPLPSLDRAGASGHRGRPPVIARTPMSVVLPARRLGERAATTALFVGNGWLIGAWAANIPRLRMLHHLSDAGLGSVLFAFGFGAVVAMAATSALAARLGPGRAAAGAGIGLALLFPAMALVPDGAALLALAALLGAINGTMDVSMNAAAAQLERRWGAAIMSSFHAGWSLGGLAGAALTGVLAGLGWGVPASLALAAGGTALCAGYGLTLRAAGAAAPPRRRARWQRPARALLGASLLALLSFSSEGAVGDWFGVYLNSVVGTGAAFATTGYTAFALAMVAGRLGGDAVVRRLGPQRTVALGGGLAALGLAVALSVPQRLVVDAGLVLVGAGLANVVPVAFTAAARIAGTGGVATATATGYAGLLVAPPLLGNVAEAIGLRPALLLVLAGAAAIAALAPSVASPRPGA